MAVCAQSHSGDLRLAGRGGFEPPDFLTRSRRNFQFGSCQFLVASFKKRRYSRALIREPLG
jgi:hypothetical protein